MGFRRGCNLRCQPTNHPPIHPFPQPPNQPTTNHPPTKIKKRITHRRDGGGAAVHVLAWLRPRPLRRRGHRGERRERRLDGDERLVVVVVVRVRAAAARRHHARQPVHHHRLFRPLLPPLPPRGRVRMRQRLLVLVVDGRPHVVGVVDHPRPARGRARCGVRAERGGGPAGRRGQGQGGVGILLLVVLGTARGGEGLLVAAAGVGLVGLAKGTVVGPVVVRRGRVHVLFFLFDLGVDLVCMY